MGAYPLVRTYCAPLCEHIGPELLAHNLAEN